jgi:histidine triad (HIT) family protein
MATWHTARGTAPAIRWLRVKCVFCEIIRGNANAAVVFEDEVSLAFLDVRPLFLGHTLLIPKVHYVTLMDLPTALLEPLFSTAQRLARGVETALGAEGSFVAMNNRISQTVPHLHIHVVPRRPKDGLKGFFWPRQNYSSEDEMRQVAERLAASLEQS